MKRKRKSIVKCIMTLVLTVAMVLGTVPLSFMPGSFMVYAATETYTNLIPTDSDDSTALENKKVTFNGMSWYIIADNSSSEKSGSVTLLAADSDFGTSEYGGTTTTIPNPTPGKIGQTVITAKDYSNSTVKQYLDSVIAGTAGDGKPNLAGVASAINDTDNGKLYLFSKDEANGLPNNVLKHSNDWWLRTHTSTSGYVCYVGMDGSVNTIGKKATNSCGVRPALQLDLSSVRFDGTNRTFDVSKETTPTATFTATGEDSGTLSGVESSMKYSTDGGSTWTDITYNADISLTDLSACTIKVVKKGDGSTTMDSNAQIITVSKAAKSNLTATQPSTAGDTGSIPTTTAHQKSTDGTNWTDCEGEWTGLAVGTYYVRVKAIGTTLASDAQSITIYLPKETTPTATFTATGADCGTLSGIESGMKYSTDGGSTWTDIDDNADINMTGLSACTIKVVKKGNNTTTSDSDAQTITVSKAETPDLAATQPAPVDDTGSIPTTTVHQKSTDGTNWTDCNGEWTELPIGIYYVRVKASGTTLASDAQIISIFETTGPGTGAIADPVQLSDATDAWSGSYVYYGKYDTDNDGTAEPVKYRVLDKSTTDFNSEDDTTKGRRTMLLDCDTFLLNMRFNESYNNTWANSKIKEWLNGNNFLGSETDPRGAFTLQERNAIAPATKPAAALGDGSGRTDLYFAGLSDESIFLLDAKEATRSSYGYSNTDLDAANRIKTKTGSGYYWWLRSPYSGYSSAGYVDNVTGLLSSTDVTGSFGVSPVFNVDLSSVIFSTLISGTQGASEAEYKLTLKDDDLEILPGSVTRDDTTITVSYTITGNNTANANRVSVLVMDDEYSAGTAKKSGYSYMRLALDSWNTSGTGTFILPEEYADKVWGTDYHVYILAEDVNGIYETDYASTPVEIEIGEKPAVDASVTGYKGVYDGQPHGIAVNVTDPGNGATIRYGNSEGSYEYDESPTIINVSDSPRTVYFKVEAENYALYTGSATITIDPKPVTVSGIKAENKTFDGSRSASLGYADVKFDGETVSGLTVTATGEFSDPNPGKDKTVTIRDLTLGGDNASNYTLAASGHQTTTKADILEMIRTITGLGTGAIRDPDVPTDAGLAWSGSYVYYGKYDGTNPTKYRVLDKASNDFGVTGGSLLLDCDSMLYNAEFDTNNKNEWANSAVRTGLNGTAFLTKNGNFSESEKNAIASVTKSAAALGDGSGRTDLYFAGLSNERIFLLDAKEATRSSYGYSNTDLAAANRIKTESDNWWWLRSSSPYKESDGTKHAGFVYGSGSESHGVASYSLGVCPVFNVNLSSVIFSSLISGTEGASGAEYKLTLKDDDLGITPGSVTRDDTTITVPYTITGSDASCANLISVLVMDDEYSAGTAKTSGYTYMRLIVDSWNTSGIGTFTLPDEYSDKIWGKDYHVYILAEDVNGTDETDYASTPVEIEKLTVNASAAVYKGVYDGQPHGIAVNVTDPGNGVTIRYGNSEGSYEYDESPTITNVSDSPKTVYYQVTAENYATKTGSAIITINKADIPSASITAPTAKVLTYNGKAQKLVNAGAVAEDIGTMKYYSAKVEDPGNPPAAPTDESLYTTSIPTATDAGTYYVWYKVDGDANHNDVAAASMEVSVEKAADYAKVEKSATAYINGKPLYLSECVSGAEGKISYSLKEAVGGCSVDAETGVFTQGNEKCECSVVVSIAESDNCLPQTAEIVVSVVDKEKADLDVTQKGVVYGLDLPAPTYVVSESETAPTGGKADISYVGTLRKDGSAYSSDTAPKEVGTYTVSVVYENDTTVYSGNAKFVIEPADIKAAVVTVSEDKFTYNGSKQTIAVTKVMLGDVELAASDYTISGNTAKDAGAYTLTVTAKESSNYTGSVEKGFAVNKVEVAPNMPKATMDVNYSVKTAGDITLPDDWVLSESDKDKDLVVGTPLKVTALYIGDDKGNYETESVDIEVTRAECKHTGMVATEAKAPTCVDAGNTAYWYCPECGRYYSDSKGETEIAKDSWVLEDLGHEYGELIYTWSDDGKTCTAKAICTRKECTEDTEGHTVTEKVQSTGKETKAATCEEKGITTYTATFENELFETQTKEVADIDAKGHRYGITTYEWSEDGKSCTATSVCSNDSTHKITETAIYEPDKADSQIKATVKEAATTEKMGTTTYTATFKNAEMFKVQTKDVVDIPKVEVTDNPSENPTDKPGDNPSKPTDTTNPADTTKPSDTTKTDGNVSSNDTTKDSSVTPAPKEEGAKLPVTDTKAEYVVTSKAGEEPAVEYKPASDAADKTVTVPESVTVDGVTYAVNEIADNAFKGNKTVESVVIPKSVKEIGDSAFSGCTNLKSVTIPGSVTEIGDNAFTGCTNLKSVKIPESVTEIGDKAFSGCKKLKSVTIGKNVAEIGDSAFVNCIALKKATLPANVTKLGSNIFKGCKNLKTITVKTTKLTSKNIAKNALKGVGNKVTIKVPKKMKKAYTKLFRKKGLSKKVKIK